MPISASTAQGNLLKRLTTARLWSVLWSRRTGAWRVCSFGTSRSYSRSCCLTLRSHMGFWSTCDPHHLPTTRFCTLSEPSTGAKPVRCYYRYDTTSDVWGALFIHYCCLGHFRHMTLWHPVTIGSGLGCTLIEHCMRRPRTLRVAGFEGDLCCLE